MPRRIHDLVHPVVVEQSIRYPLPEGFVEDVVAEVIAQSDDPDRRPGPQLPVGHREVIARIEIPPAAEKLLHQPGVETRIAPEKILRRRRLQSHLLRHHVATLDLTASHLGNEAAASRRQLVEPVAAVHHQRMLGTEVPKHARDHLDQSPVEDTHDLAGASRQVMGEWTDDVEQRAHAQFPSGPDSMSHGRMQLGREEKANANRIDGTCYSIWGKLQVDSKCLQNICAAALAGD